MIKCYKILLRVKDMDKKSKSNFTQKLTEKSLLALLVLSFVCTVMGFGMAYNEHRNLSVLSDKYQQAIDKIVACEESISILSEKIDNLQTTVPAEHPTIPEEFISDEKIQNDTTSADYNNKQNLSGQEPEMTFQPSDSKYYVTQSGSKYHISSCSYLSKSRIPVSLETIRAKRYTPCSRCIK